MTIFYAGIGSRETPSNILKLMTTIGVKLAPTHTLRSGGAGGADSAFEMGVDSVRGPKQIFIPWSGFAGRMPQRGVVFAGVGPNAMELAERFHPAWYRCSPGARKLHARNGYQVLGPRLDEPVDFVICWTPLARGSGGTGQAIRIARSRGIPIHDLADPQWERHYRELAD